MATTEAETTVVRRYIHGKHIYVAELCRPRVKNAFNDAMYQQLIDTLNEYEANDELHVLVITGHGGYFTSGADIQQVMMLIENASAVQHRIPSKSLTKKFMDAFIECKKVIVAAVNGPAVGIGVTLTGNCDFAFAAESATFWTPFMRIGVVPEFGSSFTFPFVMGPLAANDMLLRSEKFEATRALACRLVNKVFPQADFLQRVLTELEPMVNNKLTAKNLVEYKKMVHRHHNSLVREAMVHEWEELDRRYVSGETEAAAKQLLAQLRPSKKKKKSKL